MGPEDKGIVRIGQRQYPNERQRRGTCKKPGCAKTPTGKNRLVRVESTVGKSLRRLDRGIDYSRGKMVTNNSTGRVEKKNSLVTSKQNLTSQITSLNRFQG